MLENVKGYTIDFHIVHNIFRKKNFEDFLAELPLKDLERLELRYRKCDEIEVLLTLHSCFERNRWKQHFAIVLVRASNQIQKIQELTY